MAKNIVISEEVVRTRVMRVHSHKLQDAMKHGFFKRKSKAYKKLVCSKQSKKGANNE